MKSAFLPFSYRRGAYRRRKQLRPTKAAQAGVPARALTAARDDDDAPGMIPALIGGVCIGAAAGLVFVLLGRVAGITGITAGAARSAQRGSWWRASFLAGLVTAGAIAAWVRPDAIGASDASWPLAAGAGLLVGFGARYGGGCTSGHGVCGVGRLSRRSIAGCVVFMAVAMAVVFAARHGFGR
jgi:uncharacterized membrane protein YedE/YeeE